jgi:hypothetical protein
MSVQGSFWSIFQRFTVETVARKKELGAGVVLIGSVLLFSGLQSSWWWGRPSPSALAAPALGEGDDDGEEEKKRSEGKRRSTVFSRYGDSNGGHVVIDHNSRSDGGVDDEDSDSDASTVPDEKDQVK